MVVGTPKSWDGDRPGPNAKTSLDILMGWFTAPDNYARWLRAGKKKIEMPSWRDTARSDGAELPKRETRAMLCKEIVQELHAAHLTHREVRDVRSKIHDVERSFWDAVAWKQAFDEAGVTNAPATAVGIQQGVRTRRSTSSANATPPPPPPVVDIHAELRKRCRYYDMLAPVLLGEGTTTTTTQHSNGNNAAAAAVSFIAKINSLTDANTTDRNMWSADAVEGGSGKTSLDVLLDWLTTPGNYERWLADTSKQKRGQPKPIGSKEVLLKMIVFQMRANGIHHRTARDVRIKVIELERTVRAAVAWRDTYGAQILAKHSLRDAKAGLDSIRRGMTSVCTEFDRLGPVMVPLLGGYIETAAEAMDDAIVVPAPPKPSLSLSAAPKRKQIRVRVRRKTHYQEAYLAIVRGARDEVATEREDDTRDREQEVETKGDEEDEEEEVEEEEEDQEEVEHDGDEEDSEVEHVEAQEDESFDAPQKTSAYEPEDDEDTEEECYDHVAQQRVDIPSNVEAVAARQSLHTEPQRHQHQAEEPQALEVVQEPDDANGGELRVQLRLRPRNTPTTRYAQAVAALQASMTVPPPRPFQFGPGFSHVSDSHAAVSTAPRPEGTMAMDVTVLSSGSTGREKRRADHGIPTSEQPTQKRPLTLREQQQQLLLLLNEQEQRRKQKQQQRQQQWEQRQREWQQQQQQQQQEQQEQQQQEQQQEEEEEEEQQQQQQGEEQQHREHDEHDEYHHHKQQQQQQRQQEQEQEHQQHIQQPHHHHQKQRPRQHLDQDNQQHDQCQHQHQHEEQHAQEQLEQQQLQQERQYQQAHEHHRPYEQQQQQRPPRRHQEQEQEHQEYQHQPPHQQLQRERQNHQHHHQHGTDPGAATPTLAILQHQLETDRVRHEQRCHALREESLQLEVARKEIQITKEKALARHELRLAGVPEFEINHAFPLP